MLEQNLIKLGFGKNSAKVYLALIELKKSKAGKIIEYTGLHRNLVYLALEELEKNGLVTKLLKRGVAEFSANDPRHIIDALEEKKNIAESVVKEIEEKNYKQARDVLIYEGDEGVKRSRNFMLQNEPGETLYVIGSKASSSTEMEKFWRSFHLKRERQGINLQILYERGVNPEDLNWRNKLKNSRAKYLPLGIDLPIWFSFIKDYLEIGIPGQDPLVFGIKSFEAVSAFKKFFSYFWNQETTVTVGFEAFGNAWNELFDEIKSGESYDVFGVAFGLGEQENKYVNYFRSLHVKRIERKIKGRILFQQGAEQTVSKYEMEDLYFLDQEMRVLPYKNDFPVEIFCYGNVTLLLIQKEEPIIISIKNRDVTESFQKHFEELWRSARRLSKPNR